MSEITIQNASQQFLRCRRCHRQRQATDPMITREHIWTDLDIQPGEINRPRRLLAATLRCPACHQHMCTMLIEP